MKTTGVVALALAGSAAAFMPVAPLMKATAVQKMSSTQTHMSLEGMVGVGPETGNKIFDPLGLSEFAPVEHMRKAEIANGRVAMLAVVGWLVPELIGKFPATDIESTHAIPAFFQANPAAWWQIILVCGIIEGNKYRHEISGSDKPFFDPAGIYPKDKAGQELMELKELKNGRMAMIAWAAFLCHEIIPGSVPVWVFNF